MAIASADAGDSYRIATGKGHLREMALGISSPLPPAVVSVDDGEDEADEYVSNLVEQIACAMLDDDEISALEKRNVVTRAPALMQAASHCPVRTPQLMNSGIWSTPLSRSQARYVPLYHNDTEASYTPQKESTSLVRSVASPVSHTCTSEARTQELEVLAAAGLDDSDSTRQVASLVDAFYRRELLHRFLRDAAFRARAKFDVEAPTNGCWKGVLLPSHVGVGHQADFLCSSALPIKMAFEAQISTGVRVSGMSNSFDFARDGPLRRESTGTGVFLPRVHVTNARQRRRQGVSSVSNANGGEGKVGSYSMKR